MGVNIATAYVTLIPEVQGIQGDFDRIFGAAGQQAGQQFSDGFGGELNSFFSGGFGKILKAGALIGAVGEIAGAAAAAFSSTFGEAMEREASTTKVAASLGLSDAEAKSLGTSAGKLYTQAYGESFSDVTGALEQVKSSIKGLGAEELEGVTKKALSFSSAFEVDVARSVSSVNTLIGSGLASNADEAFDVITAASQKVPAALREDVLDASDEYSQFFNALGFDANQAFGALTSASDKGVFGIDKTGDAIKEFTIRATDMSTGTTAAFQSIGLDAQQMANDILAGGDTAQGATQKIIDGLLGIEDPATQANTAIALFGTPLEDLGVSNIPQFLSSLDDATGGLGDFTGAAADLDAKLGNTIQSKFTSLTRTLEGFGPTLSAAFLPVVGPILDGLTSVATVGQEKLQSLSDNVGGFFAGFNGDTDVELTDNQRRWAVWGDQVRDAIAGPLQRAQGQWDAFWGGLSTGFGDGGGPLAEIGAAIHDTFGETLSTLRDTFGQVLDQIGPPLMEAFGTIWEAVKPLVPTFLELFQAFNPVGLLFKAITPILPQIAGMLGDLATVLADGIAQALKAVAPLFEAIVGVINRLMPFITQLVASLLPPLMRLFEKLSPLLGAILDALLPVVEAIISALIPAIEAILPVVERVFTFIADTIGNIIDVFSGVIDFLTGVFTGDWSLMWQGVQEIFGGVWDQIQSTVSFVWDTISAVIKAGWENVIRPVFDAVMAGVTSVGDFFSRLWTDVVSPVWQWISDKITAVWNWIRDSVFAPLNAGITNVGSFFSGLWKTVSDVWQWIQDKIGAVWAWISANVFAPLNAGIQGVGQFFSDLWGTVSDVWQWIQDKISGVWTWLNQNVFEPMNLAINTVSTFMSNLWTTVETVWGKISTFFADIAAGISSAVDTVKTAISDITKAIKDFIAEKFGLDDRPNGVFGLRPTGELLGVGPGSARGGIVPGVDPGRRDNVLMPLRSEESVMVPEFTHAVGGAAGVYAMNRAAEAGRLSDVLGPGFARGGVVGQWAHDAVATPALALLEWAKGQIMEELSAQVGASGDMLADFGPENFSGPALNTQAAADFIRRTWPQITDIGTWRAAGSVAGSDHPKGKALDAMLPGYSSPAGKQLGTNVAEWFRTNPWNFGTKYVIYYDRIADGGGGWGPYSHPGGNNDTLAHRDHVHISFLSGKNPHYTAPVGDGAYPAGVEGGAFPPLVERWRSLGLDVLGKVGQYKGLSLTQYIDRMLNQIRTESSGDPNAINNYDINAQRGDPSIGLLQVIGSTFRNALKGTPFEYLIAAGQRDPRASLTSSTLYSLNRYGSLDKAWRGVAYDSGGWLMPGVTPTLNLLNRPEAVLTPPQSDALITHAQNLAGGFGGRAELDPGAIRQALDGMSMQLTDEDGNGFTARMRSTARAVVLDRERALRRH